MPALSGLAPLHHTEAHQGRWKSGGRVGGISTKRAPQHPRGSSRQGQSADSRMMRSSNKNLSAVFHREPCKPVRARPLANVATQPDEYVRKVDEPANTHSITRTHGEQKSSGHRK